MRSKKTLGFISSFSSMSQKPSNFVSKALSKEQIYTIFPSMPKDIQYKVKVYYDQKIKMQHLIESSILPDMIKQARLYLSDGRISDCTAATGAIMQFIQEFNIDQLYNSKISRLLAQAYYLNGMVKSIGTLDARQEAEKSFSEAIKLAKKSGYDDILSLANNELRGLELNRYQLRKGESFEFSELDEDTKSTRKFT